MKICIAVTCLLAHDAIGNDAVRQLEIFHEHGLSAVIHADEVKRSGMAEHVVNREALLKFLAVPDNILIYHHGGCWDNGLALLQKARCRIFIKYHNITPPAFFTPYNDFHEAFCRRGRKQTPAIARLDRVEKYLCDSRFNARDFLQEGVPASRIAVVPPFHKLNDFGTARIDADLARHLDDGRINLLFVGRQVPNKGHLHLLGVAAGYGALYGRGVRLILAGGMDPGLKTYQERINRIIADHHLAAAVEIKDRVRFDELHTLYDRSHAFLLMSGHEGFCLPILEAQYHDLPVLALDAGAVGETLGPDQLLFDRPDYHRFAAAVRVVTGNAAVAGYLAARGRENLKRFAADTLEKQFLTAVLGPDPAGPDRQTSAPAAVPDPLSPPEKRSCHV